MNYFVIVYCISSYQLCLCTTRVLDLAASSGQPHVSVMMNESAANGLYQQVPETGELQ